MAMIDPPLPEIKIDYWRTIFNAVVPDDNNGIMTMTEILLTNQSSYLVVMKTPPNLRYPKFGEDRRLGARYCRAMSVLTREERQIEK